MYSDEAGTNLDLIECFSPGGSRQSINGRRDDDELSLRKNKNNAHGDHQPNSTQQLWDRKIKDSAAVLYLCVSAGWWKFSTRTSGGKLLVVTTHKHPRAASAPGQEKCERHTTRRWWSRRRRQRDRAKQYGKSSARARTGLCAREKFRKCAPSSPVEK